ncbi:hypothetical protein K458DRAFT_488512 [Lentithecium fluviatile CBS 122367]|uniref:PhoD-like phosphatase domain-containing protein n=1 Tax=Lentithecium fluviatile CBS 122367 TaxID=1168545 RepID=A0A6G1IX03_9PLEO|nr:hypothetical protein K458DRAFT_488512 [Lentithecium fluviatile CBS 122367]
MENRGNSASYSSRGTYPSQQPLPDGYSKKGASYRRPIDAQPTPAQAPPPAQATGNPVPSNSARPVAAAPAANGVTRTSSHRRRQSQQIPPPTTGTAVEPLPAAPDVPRGPPPTSYRDPYAPKGGSRVPTRPYHSGRSRDPPIQLNASRQQPSITIPAERLQQLRSPPYTPVEPLSGTIEGPTRRDSGRRPSVPDRSPLQKLEGKLDDISKEERRARILEIELAAQEKAEAEMRARRAREAAAKQQRIVSGPAPTAEQAPTRTTSTRRHVSMPAQQPPKSPLLSDLSESEDGYGYDLSEPWDPAGGQTATGPHGVPSHSKSQRLSSGSQRQKHTLNHMDATVGRAQSVKGKEPVGVSRGSGSFRDRVGTTRGMEATEKPRQPFERKPVPVPTGLGLFGVDEPPNASRQVGADLARYDSTRLSKDLPPTPKETANSNGRRRDSRGIMAAQMEMERQRNDQPRGLDHLQPTDAPVAPISNRRSVGFADLSPEREPENSTNSHHHFPDVFSRHHDPDRRYVPPTMLEEWKNAPIGLLLEDDLNLEAPQRSNSTSANKAWWEESASSRQRRSSGYAETTYDGYVDAPTTQTSFNPPLYLKCGPLLRYTGLRRDKSRGKDGEIWRGSVMIVTIDEQSSYQKPPTLRLFKQPMDLQPPPPAEVNGDDLHPSYVDPLEGQVKVSRTGKTLYAKPIDIIPEDEDISRVEDHLGLFSETRSGNQKSSRIHKKDGEKLGKVREIPGVRLHAERGVTFWRFNLEVELGTKQERIAYRINRGPAIGFWVPAKGETMNMMFHSCNGFSLSVDSKQFCGPDPMWRDVLNNHQTRPFHVMIGGGDQIYNDAAMRDTVLFKQWTESKNPLQKHNAPFSDELQNELEQFYLDRYSMWFSQGLFGMANSQIPMINIWDDHDIIDGYGSYPHHFMQTPVFTGLGAVAFKYYMLFQHQSVAAETEKTEPSWVLGAHLGPYIKERSRSVFMQLGRRVAFLGLDCRTERQRDEVITEDSYDFIFDRLEDEIIKGETKHLIVLLGVPIAYPRLNFLENILTSRLMDPIKAMGRAGMLGNFINRFDGGVEILDDLDDHWTAKHHKDERNWFIRELQHIASTKSVRVTILGGDVHLAAVGQFYTNKKLGIPKDKDHRYMPNVISSAIVNTPPPEIMADIINKRNKVHHLDPFTDEDMIPLFTYDVDGKKRNNTHLLQRRNWCSLREYKPGTTPPATPSPPPSPRGDEPRLTRTLSDYTPRNMVRRMSSNGKRGRDRGPPVSYYNNPANIDAHNQQTAPQSSFSPERPEQPRSRRNSLTSLFRRRASVDSVNPPGSSQSMPLARNSFAERPSNFHRRPSMLEKKGLDAQGGYINLEGGLDVCLNLEVSQHDPAGITNPYRLLVPALDYIPQEEGTVEKERHKSRIGSMFGAFKGSRRKHTVGDDGYSHSGDSANESGGEEEMDEEERARQRYKVGPRIVIPGFTNRKRASSQSQPSPGHRADPISPTGPGVTLARDAPTAPQNRRQSVDIAPSHPTPVHQTSSAWESVAAKRHVSAPVANYNTMQTQTAALPTRSISTRQPSYNSSHKSQLPSRPAPEPAVPKVQRRSMGGILNQHRGERFEHDAHVLAHTPSRSKRDSYPPHPAIVGAGPGSPYSRGAVQARIDAGAGPTGDYFSSGGRNGTAGVGARYLGDGRYADSEEDSLDEDGRSYSGDERHVSQESFVPPKKNKWKIWK